MVIVSVDESSQGERMVMTVAEIVRQLIEAHQNGKDINLNKYRYENTLCTNPRDESPSGQMHSEGTLIVCVLPSVSIGSL